MHQPAQRMLRVQTPVIPVVGKLIAENPGTISLGQGVVHYPPPPEAQQAAAAFWRDANNHKYSPVDGIAQLTESIAAKLRADNNTTRTADRSIVVTAGGNMAFINALYAITDPGDEVIILRPFYFNHEMAIHMVGAVPVIVDTDSQYQPDLAAIESALTPRTRAVVTISPNNPTGAVYDETTLRAINALCKKQGIYHINDEAYEYFTYDGAAHFSPGSIDDAADHTISLYSLSKAFGFAGWRIGYMIVPQHLLMSVKKAQDTILICPTTASQHAAVAAMAVGRSYCDSYIAQFAGVRRLVLDELMQLGDRCIIPPANGAFYVFLTLRSDLDPMHVVERLIREHRVAAIPGATFGTDGCRLRLAFGSLQKDTVAEGIGRFVKGIKHILQ